MPAKKRKSMGGRYINRGVSPTKTEVHSVVDRLDAGLFPGAFCKITEDYLNGDPKKCSIIHSDGSGTKSILAYLHYKETGDVSVFQGIAQDSIVMNLDDLICTGAHEKILISNTINRNARRCPGEVLAALIEGTENYLQRLRAWGISIFSGGGETADVGDLTGTILVDSCAATILSRNQVIDGSRIGPGLVIVGLASSGKSRFDDVYNSGIGSNGLTSARHDLLSKYYARKYPETVDGTTKKSLVYCGRFKLPDRLPLSDLTVGQALLSPTRSYAPILKTLFKENFSAIHGAVHCSGGGQTKCLKFGRSVHYIKDNLFEVPAVFKAIRKASGTSLREMYQVFNMGHRMEIYCQEKDAPWVISVSEKFGVEAKVVGRIERSAGPNQLTLQVGGKLLAYTLPSIVPN
jgi:phosphoribosylformylglycinamidine cyclo-ligase